MKLSELYGFEEQNIDWQWHGDAFYCSFEVEGQSYMAQMRKIQKGNFVYKQFTPPPEVSNDTWYYAFAPMDKDTGQPINSRFPSDNPIQLIKKVINIAIQFIYDHHVDILYYGGDKNDPARLRVYNMITKKMTSRHDWELAGESDANFMGVVSHFYVIKKK